MLDLKKLIDKVLTFIKPKTGTITALNNFTLYEVNVMERWGVVSVSGYATRSSAIGTSEVRIGTVSGVSLPTHHIRKHTGTGTQAYSPTNNGYVILNESGGLLCKSTSTSDRTIVFDFCYVVGGVLRNPVISTASRIGGVLNALNQKSNCKGTCNTSNSIVDIVNHLCRLCHSKETLWHSSGPYSEREIRYKWAMDNARNTANRVGSGRGCICAYRQSSETVSITSKNKTKRDCRYLQLLNFDILPRYKRDGDYHISGCLTPERGWVAC